MSGLSNLESPDIVVSIHRDYCRAGSQVILANTFAMNSISAATAGLEAKMRDSNLAAVELARQAAGEKCLVLGDMGPTGKLLEPYGDYREEQLYDCFAEQAVLLEQCGVDGIIIETMTDLREGVCALKAIRDKTSLPVMLSLSFSTAQKGGRTVMGSSVADTARAAEQYGALAVGANCGDLDPEGMAEIAALFKAETFLPVMIQPNAGMPKLVEGKTRFDMEPGAYAAGLLKCIEKGASIVGGCCGTGPAHIEAIRLLLN